jgi:hypothetical protein
LEIAEHFMSAKIINIIESFDSFLTKISDNDVFGLISKVVDQHNCLLCELRIYGKNRDWNSS